ncbi:MAG: heparinase II/III family protein [Armatimonadota bacterium]|nr:heparinase II/III family protein [Armatimonadota bacterium]
MKYFICGLIPLLLLVTVPAHGNFLDEYLHTIQIDQQSPWRAADKAAEFLRAPHLFGQTFVTGPKVEEIYQIAIHVPYVNPNWSEGTSLVMTLYDSPAKTKKLAEFAMRYEWRCWEDMVMVFPMKAEAQPNTQYYFELSAEGGEGVIGPILKAGGDYPNGTAYIDGKPQDFDFAFQVYVHNQWDRDKAYAEAFSMFDLNYPGMEQVRAAVERKDWEAAAKALVAHFESRKAFREIVNQPKPSQVPDLTLAELAADTKIRDADGNILSLGPNWNHLKWWPTRGGVGLTREGIRKYLALGYSVTKDPKYARAWNEMLKAVLKDLPSPIKAGVIPPDAKDIPPINAGGIAGGSMWSGLALGARLAHEFYYYAAFVEAPEFTWDVRAAFIINLGDMADVLAKQKGGGNWATQMYNHLFYFATEFPEFARSKQYAELAFNGLLQNMRETLLPDGPIGESAGYQMLVHNQYLDILDRADALKIQIPEDVKARIERALEFHMYTVTPDGFRPAFGDALGDKPLELLKRGAQRFGREDMLWVATQGKQGNPPGKTSVEFPYSKYYVMRSSWNPDALYMCIKNGRYTAHGHFDSLGFELHAYGNPLIVDPGIYIYGTPDAQKLVSTQSHSTISVDGANLQNGGGPNQFFAAKTIDYFSGIGPEYQGLHPTIRLARSVAFLKPDYWIISDVVDGSGKHTVDSRFHFSDTHAALDQQSGIARTTKPKGGNLLIIPVGKQVATSKLESGFTAFVHEKKEPALILCRSAEVELPFAAQNILYPIRDPSTKPPKVRLLDAETRTEPKCVGIEIKTPRGTDHVVFCSEPDQAARFPRDRVAVRAQFAAVRRDLRGRIKSFAMVWGSTLHDGAVLARSDRPVPGVEVVYAGDTVELSVKDPDPSLRVAALGCSYCRVNGGPRRRVRPIGGMIAPFADPVADATVRAYCIVDDESPHFRVEGSTKGGEAGGGGEYGFHFRWSHVSPGRDGRFIYEPALARPGLYEVRICVPRFRLVELTRAARVKVCFAPNGKWIKPASRLVRIKEVRPEDGTALLEVDQAEAAGSWVPLGTYEFAPPRGSRVEILCDAEIGGPAVVADAVKWVLRNSASADERSRSSGLRHKPPVN